MTIKSLYLKMLANPRPVYLSMVGLTASMLLGYYLAVFNTVFFIVSAELEWCPKLCDLTTEPNDVIYFQPVCEKSLLLQSWINGVFLLSAALGSLLSSVLLQKGTKNALMAIFIIMGTSSGISYVLRSTSMLILLRSLTGVSAGLATVVPSVFLTERVPITMRGLASLLPPIATNTGIFLGVCFGLLLKAPSIHEPSNCNMLAYQDYEFNKWYWRLMVGLGAPFCAAAFAVLYRVTLETPTTYQKLPAQSESSTHGEEAPTTAVKIEMSYSAEAPTAESDSNQNMIELSNLYSKDSNSPQDVRAPTDSSFSRKLANLIGNKLVYLLTTLFQPIVQRFKTFCVYTPALYNRLLTGSVLAILQQLSGINVFISTSNTILAMLGVPPYFQSYGSAGLMLTGLVCSLVAPLYINQIKRRKTLLYGSAFMFLSLIPVIISLNFFPESKTTTYCLMLSTLSFIISYGLSLGPVLFLYLNELYPPSIKDFGLSLAFMLNWLACFAAVDFSSRLTLPQTFTVFGSICCVKCAFVHFLLPETKYDLTD